MLVLELTNSLRMFGEGVQTCCAEKPYVVRMPTWVRGLCFGFRVLCFKLRDWCLGLRDLRFGFRDLCFGCRDLCFGFRDLCFGLRDRCFGFRGLCFGFQDVCFGFKNLCFGFRDLFLGFRGLDLGSRVDTLRVGQVSRGEKILYPGTDPESYITEYTLVYEDESLRFRCEEAF